jgi:subtilisin family serine protease
MKRFLLYSASSLFVLLLLGLNQKNQALEREGVVTLELERELEKVSLGDWIPVNISMEDQVERSYLENKPESGMPYSPTLTSNERRRAVVKVLKEFSSRDQKHLLRFLREQAREEKTRKIRSLWISNTVSAEVKKELVGNLSRIEGIRSIGWDGERNFLLGTERDSPPRTASIEWNISLINAPAVWAQGYTGQGVVVGNLDTGVNYNHDDLQDHIWTNPGEIPSNSIDDDVNGYIDDVYGYDFVNRDGDPLDDHGHGTHTAGTIAGDGTAGDTTGVAPDAEIMIMKILNSGGFGTFSDILEGIGYAVDNGAQVMSLSIAGSLVLPDDRALFRNAFNNAHTVEVISAIAAGNFGSSLPPPFNIGTPGDTPPPWLHPEQTLPGGLSSAVTVGATDAIDNIAGFSSRGPASWELVPPWNDYPYIPEMGLIDPDVCAPGVCVTSLDAFDNNGYVSCWDGTSMATPHVAGLMALILQKNPALSLAEIDSLIETTAVDLGIPGKDNTFGTGRIDALAAIDATPLPSTPSLSVMSLTLADTTGGDGDGRPEENETAELVVTLENLPRVLDASQVQSTLSTSDPTLSLLDSIASYPDIPAGSSRDNQGDPYVFTVAPGTTPHWASFTIVITAQPGNYSRTDTFSIRIERPLILLVDDDEGASYDGSINDYRDYYIIPLDNIQRDYDEWNTLTLGSPGSELDHYSCVIWFTGDDSTTTITPQNESDLSPFLDGGGNLFLSSKDVGQEIGGSSAFYTNYLKATFFEGFIPDLLMSGVAGDAITNGINITFFGPNGAGNGVSMDKISPLPGADSIFTYNSTGGAGAIKYDSGVYRLVYMAFAFEAISGLGPFASRDTVMARVLDWLCPVTVGVEEDENDEYRTRNIEFRLLQNNPNPFSKLTAISYQLKAGGHTSLKLYDITGRLVNVLVDAPQEAGVYQVQWNGRIPESGVQSGIYFYRLQSSDFKATKKLILLR